MTRVTALTSGKNVPSARFRVRQHLSRLCDLGFDVQEYYPRISKYAGLPAWPPQRSVRWAPHFLPWQGMKLAARAPGIAASWLSEITWIERELLPGRYTLERILGGRIALDVDDAIWLASPRAAEAARAIARRADVVLAGNAFLADWFSSSARSVRIVPTAVDSDRFRPKDKPEREGSFVIGWTGSASTLPYLEAIENALHEVLRDIPRAQLLVIADRAPAFARISADRVRYLRWSESIEADALREIDVGIMPLPDDDWARGKCSFKMLQYMSCGVPVVVSPVGMNAEVLARGELGYAASREDEWQDALRALAADRSLGRWLGKNGRRVIEENFSVAVVSRRIADAFHELLS